MAEDKQTATTFLDSTSNRTIGEDVEDRWGMDAKNCNKRSLCWDGDIFASTGVMIAGIVGGLSHEGMEG